MLAYLMDITNDGYRWVIYGQKPDEEKGGKENTP
jgi:hypothetical protein